MGTIGDLHDAALTLLGFAADALDTIPSYDVLLLGAPDRQFVTHGLPALDCCEQLAVHVQFPGELDTSPGGLEAGKRKNRARRNVVTLLVTATRCFPSDLEPAPEVLTEAARQTNADCWVLWNHLFTAAASGQLLTLCDGTYFDGMTPLGPSGGCAGWIATVRVVLDGYGEPFGS